MDSAGGFLYVDGAQKAYMPWTGGRISCTTTQPLSFARYPGSGFFKGSIDEVTIWDVAQPQSWIAASLDRGLIGNEANLIAVYRLNEGSGGTAFNNAPSYGIGNGSLRPRCHVAANRKSPDCRRNDE